MRRAGALTVLGGPHAKAFPRDALRFFDLVVGQCDRGLVAEILAKTFPPGTAVASGGLPDDLPTVEERMPEIHASAFLRGSRPFFATMVPLLASLGCPYRCDFCTDWNTRSLGPSDLTTLYLRTARPALTWTVNRFNR